MIDEPVRRNDPSPLLRQRYEAVFHSMLLMAVLSYGSYCGLFFALGVPLMPYVNLAALALCGVAWALVARSQLRLAMAVMAVVVVGHAAPATWVLGWSANFHLFAFLFVVFALLSPELKLESKIAIVVAVTLAYLLLDARWHDRAVALPARIQLLFRILNIVVFSGTIAYLTFIYSRAIWAATEALHTLNEQLTRIATTDSLTGLLNRRSMSELIDHELARFRRTGQPFAVILGDIDDFKHINDQHGHNIGDAALVATASALKAAVREVDRVGRWGGEEFLTFLPESDAQAASLVARRVQERLNDAQVSSGEGSVSVRMTFGIAEARADVSADELLAAADHAMYEGKRGGKNRVVVA